MAAMRLTYDPDPDTALVYVVDHIRPGDAPRSSMNDFEIRGGAVVLLFDCEGRLLGDTDARCAPLTPRVGASFSSKDRPCVDGLPTCLAIPPDDDGLQDIKEAFGLDATDVLFDLTGDVSVMPESVQ